MSGLGDIGYKPKYYSDYGITSAYWGTMKPGAKVDFRNSNYGAGNGATTSGTGTQTYSATNNILRNIGTGTNNTANTGTTDTSFGSAFGDGLNYGQIGKDANGNLVKGGLFSNSVPTDAEALNYNKMVEIGGMDNPTFAQQEDYRNFMKDQKGLGSAELQTGLQAASALYQGLVSDPASRKIARDRVAVAKEANRLNREQYNAYRESGRNKSALINSIIG